MGWGPEGAGAIATPCKRAELLSAASSAAAGTEGRCGGAGLPGQSRAAGAEQGSGEEG